MLIDDAWATVFLQSPSFPLFGNGELNAAFSDPEVVAPSASRAPRTFGANTSHSRRAALQLFRQIARENGQRHANGDPSWQGLAIGLDAASYGMAVQF